VAEVTNLRRFYLHKRIEARVYDDTDLDTVWQSKQESISGTPLAESFPNRTALAAIGYTTVEDLDGADEEELVRAGLSQHQATEVIAAL
jgi:hypothetical protein